jgi:hypothetical protein
LPGNYEFGFTLKSHGSTYYERVRLLVVDRDDPQADQIASEADPRDFVVWTRFPAVRPAKERRVLKAPARGMRSKPPTWNEEHRSHSGEDASEGSESNDGNDKDLAFEKAPGKGVTDE